MAPVVGSVFAWTTADGLWTVGCLAALVGVSIWLSTRGGGGITRRSPSGMYADGSWAGRAIGLFGTRVRGGQSHSADLVSKGDDWGEAEWGAYADLSSSVGGRRVPGWVSPALLGLVLLGAVAWFVFVVH